MVALVVKASSPGFTAIPNSLVILAACSFTSLGSWMISGVTLPITSSALYPSMASAPLLKLWILPSGPVEMTQICGLFRMACSRVWSVEFRDMIMSSSKAELQITESTIYRIYNNPIAVGHSAFGPSHIRDEGAADLTKEAASLENKFPRCHGRAAARASRQVRGSATILHPILCFPGIFPDRRPAQLCYRSRAPELSRRLPRQFCANTGIGCRWTKPSKPQG